MAIVDLNLSMWAIVPLIIAIDFCIYVIVQFLEHQDNVILFCFLVSLPFVLFWTETANHMPELSLLAFISTIYLCVSLPFVFVLLFVLWELAGD